MTNTRILLYLLGCLTLVSGSALLGTLLDGPTGGQVAGLVSISGSLG